MIKKAKIFLLYLTTITGLLFIVNTFVFRFLQRKLFYTFGLYIPLSITILEFFNLIRNKNEINIYLFVINLTVFLIFLYYILTN
jgi:bacteriorhodopsin